MFTPGDPNAAHATGSGAKGTIKIGIPYAKNSSAALAALGGSASSATDQSAMFKAVIADANKHGGIAGYRIAPVFVGIDVTGDQAAQYQSACATFTQDNKVFAAIGIGSTSYYSCLQKAGVVVLAPPDGDAKQQAQWPLQLAPDDMYLDRAARTYATALAAGYLSGKPRIGLLTYTAGAYQRVTNDVLLPALKRFDPSVVVQSVTRAQTAADVGSMSSAVSNAVLRFRSAGVNHVVFFVDGGLPESYFVKNAQSQGYHPRYAFNTYDQLQATIEAGLFSGAEGELSDAVGVGWQPILDTAFPSPFMSNAPARRCLAIGKANGIAPTSSTAASQLVSACDAIWFLQAAAARATSVTAPAVVRAATSLGSFPSAVTQRANFAGNRDGADGYQTLEFHADCGCVRASGPVRQAAR